MKKRRDFLKATGAALGGAAITGILSVEAKAEPQEKAAVGRARKGVVTIRCTPNIKVEAIHDAIKQSLGFVGCPACGLLGIDIHIGGGDPEPFNLNVPGAKGGFNAM